ncbi:hypothetical protein HDV05_006478 [Chytridiales sp. JEL 0842]|nr:hypothetical protein HDV05_006478 [Chytridiales sp. JEL 0842]
MSTQLGNTPIPSYLSESFDPESASINELVSILSERGIGLPAKREKKQFYIDLFQNEIASNRAKIISKLEKIRMLSPVRGATPRKSVAALMTTAGEENLGPNLYFLATFEL